MFEEIIGAPQAKMDSSVATVDESRLMNIQTKRVVTELGKRIRQFRRARGYTQADFSELTGLTQGYISQIESGNVEPTIETLWITTGVLDVTLSTLFKDIERV
jgi:DNA-binding XRE family transcriptional regulator